MDQTMPPWSQDRFNTIQQALQALLSELKFGDKAVRYVPVSGLVGSNLTQRCSATDPNTQLLSEWYDGPCLIEMLDSFKEPERKYAAPLRAVVTSLCADVSRGYELRVNVLQGRIRRGRCVGAAKIQGAFEVKKITKDDGSLADVLYAGEDGNIILHDR